MKRKLIELAKTTKVVSLPLKWVKKHNLKKGDELNLDIRGSDILLSLQEPVRQEIEKEITIKKETPLRYVRSLIYAHFRKGTTTLNVNFDGKEILNEIFDSLQQTIGYEIINQTKNTCTIKSVARFDKEQFKEHFRRLFHLITLISTEILTQWQAQELENNTQLNNLQLTVQRIVNSCFQMLSVKEESTIKTNYFTYLIINNMYKISNEYGYITKHINKEKSKPNKALLDYFRKTNAFLKELISQYFCEETNDNEKFTVKKDALLWKDGYGLIAQEPILIHHLMSIVRRTYEIAGFIVGENT